MLFMSAFWFWNCLPDPLFDASFSTVLVDRDGKLLSAAIAADEQWRFPPRTRVPEKIRKAFVAYEDKRFFSHYGVDPLAFLRAMGQNLRSRKVVSGASTITMQVIRLARQGQPRTIREKLIEMIMALRLELSLNKEDILALYVSHAPFGGNVVGLDAASWRYFGREPEQLSWAESAMLAVLPNSPALVHPGKNRIRLLKKRNDLLDKLRETGAIDDMSCTLGKEEQLPPAPHSLPMLAPHLLARIRKESADIADRGRIQTSLNKQFQTRSIEILDRYHALLASGGIHNAAALILDVNSGQALAYVGNVHDFRSDEHGNYVDIITAPRSTGSTLKPFLYAGMIAAGELLPTQLVPDIPTKLGGFRPQNFSETYQGAVPASMALARSLNVPTVRLLSSYSVDRFSALLKRLGMTTLHRPAQQYGLSLIIGGAEGSLWELTGMYASMARRLNNYATNTPDAPAFFPPTYQIGTRLIAPQENPLDAAACWLTFEAMLEVVRPGAESAWEYFPSAHKIAWKTGTSYGFRDAWAIGVTPQYAVGVWVGNADGEGRPNLTGSVAAAPILFELFDVVQPHGWFPAPELDLVPIEVCAKSGYRAGPNCETRKTIRVPRAALRAGSCPYCQIIHTDSLEQWRVHSNCEPVAAIRSRSWFVLPPAMEWYYKQAHSDYQPLPPYRDDCLATLTETNTPAMTLMYPPRNGKIYIPIELSGQRGRVVFELAHRTPQKSVYWHLDDQYLGETRDIHQVSLAPSPGEHTLTLVDEDGEFLQSRFTVLTKEE
ncbi:penicillin-binding protein 1C [Candidatus Moduliflexus flocculans]|uniref:peptidoglycan glycosyltransferase n=1 Tax=Candidatus Moduliflexus flocculans TaxID=1499966 RepID=A0A0S6VVX4_9BACT|nr:penicillin-binding protein 1C [Candidatus Moduliflexus flocculans]